MYVFANSRTFDTIACQTYITTVGLLPVAHVHIQRSCLPLVYIYTEPLVCTNHRCVVLTSHSSALKIFFWCRNEIERESYTTKLCEPFIRLAVIWQLQDLRWLS